MQDYRDPDSIKRTRREFLTAASAALALCAPPLSAATSLPRTPRQSPGPFYPATLPLDRDNDLVHVTGRPGTARGVITQLSGRIMDDGGRPISAARVEIWQCNAYGRYHHPRDGRSAPIDENFQGYGQFTTGDDGYYRFRTIRPVPYPGRAPHIHFAITATGIESLTTQMYVAGEPRNARDGLLNSIRDDRARASLVVQLRPASGAPDELWGAFDLVLASDGRFARADARLLEALRRSV
jgi:protocatechuate 3,4-dioxygenase beta subunit